MRMRVRLALAVFFVMGVALQAQTVTTGPVTATMHIAWSMAALADAGVTTPAEAQALTYTAVDTLGGVAASPIPITGTACLTGTPFTCSALLPAALVTSLNRVGQHSMTLTASNSAGASISLPFLLSTPLSKPPVPTGVRITP